MSIISRPDVRTDGALSERPDERPEEQERQLRRRPPTMDSTSGPGTAEPVLMHRVFIDSPQHRYRMNVDTSRDQPRPRT